MFGKVVDHLNFISPVSAFGADRAHFTVEGECCLDFAVRALPRLGFGRVDFRFSTFDLELLSALTSIFRCLRKLHNRLWITREEFPGEKLWVGGESECA